MKNCFLILTILVSALSCFSQQLNWRDAKSWKIYDLRGRAAMRAKVDSLGAAKNVRLDSVVLNPFLNEVSIWPEDKSAVWMGAYLATCEMADKKLRKILISTYGGFFYDELTRRYYEIPKDAVDDWLTFLHDAVKTLIEE